MKAASTRRLIALTLWTLIAASYALISWLTPLYSDDYVYTFLRPAPDPGYPLVGPLVEAYSHWFGGVGRLVPHLLVGLFTLVLPKWILALTLGVSFWALCRLSALYAVADRAKRLAASFLAAAMVWFVIPGIFQAGLWRSGVCNYLFIALLVLGWLLIYRRQRSVSIGRGLLLAIYGICVGWTNEGFIVGLAGAVFLQAVARRGRLAASQWWLASGLWLGALCLVLSPFNLHRFFEEGGWGGASMVHGYAVSLLAVFKLRIFMITLSCVLLTWLLRPSLRHEIATWLRGQKFVLTAWAIGVAFIVTTRHTAIYARFTVETYMLLVLLSFVFRFLPLAAGRAVGLAAALATAGGMLIVVPAAWENTKMYRQMEQQLAERPAVCYLVSAARSPYMSRYVKPPHQASFFNRLITEKHIILNYYGAPDSTLILPEELRGRHASGDTVKTIRVPSWQLRAISLPDDVELTGVSYELSDSALSWWQRPLAPFFEAYNARTVPASFVTLDTPEGRWALVFDNSAIEFRTTGLSITVEKCPREE